MHTTSRQLGLWSKIISKIPFSSRRPLGRDLAGNRYYELPNPAGGRSKRVVEYADSPTSYAYSSPDDYRRGTAQLPVQWTAWMSHTRADPPSMAELEADARRQAALRARVLEIEARERAERIQQGYLLPDGSEAGERKVPLALGGAMEEEGTFASAGGTPHASAKFAYPPAPREKLPPKGSAPVAVDLAAGAQAAGAGQAGRAHAELAGRAEAAAARASLAAPETREETPLDAEKREPIVPPRAKVDALSTDPETLRKLAEEDTRRRLRESGVSEEGVGEAGVTGVGRAFRPRKRGA
ncbi:hypothetical protein CC85DRAFT_330706 [Cutaneotrichosporon oleaginosum]|uniref:NADH dehydrogenase [ubiquinone] 1 alpha subcomplex subunit n=1 Tax=Cutaneotrichosporon oleaginosum TaxID=879819 RepID=A0A0J0XEF3_9TREE|nr:uncharacterized protein CC85DRAFT_330706 [Cutaneotrichosporon oleaginosum]KLT39455.1 hypothetical protein CC85DRAFT_330706 [Cutaneotrichosporon oleaginosum]TXT09962.1 hypothetical protein COLE_03896 [Cutaneotrichosporon oleaginosum]